MGDPVDALPAISSKEMRRLRQSAWNFTYLGSLFAAVGLMAIVPMILGATFLPDIFLEHAISPLLASVLFFTVAYTRFYPRHKTETTQQIIYVTYGALVMDLLHRFLT